MVRELIIAISEHRRFGTVLTPLVISKTVGGGFYSSLEKASKNNLKDLAGYNAQFDKLVEIALEIDDTGISKSFNKGKDGAAEYVQKVDEELIHERIRPYIERRILKIVKLSRELSLRLFVKTKGYSQIYEADEVKLPEENAEAIFSFTKSEDGIRYNLQISHNGESISLKNSKALFLVQNPCVVAVKGYLYQFDNIDSKKLQPFLLKDFISVPKSSEKVYMEKFVYNTIKDFKVVSTGFDIIEKNGKGKASLYLQQGLNGKPVLLLKLTYGSKVILPNNPGKRFVSLEVNDQTYVFEKRHRDDLWEKDLHSILLSLGLRSKDKVHYNPQSYAGEELYATINWLNANQEALYSEGISVKQEFFENKFYTGKIDLNFSIQESKDWFDLKGTVTLGEFKIPFLKLRRNILNEDREYKLPDGTIAIIPIEWFARFQEMLSFAKEKDGELRLSKKHFSILEDELESESKGYMKGLQELTSLEQSSIKEQPQGLKATLRSYQLLGYQWMSRLKAQHFGGILADDMGLGKTLQTLSLLLSASKDEVKDVIEPDEAPSQQSAQLSLFDTPDNLPKLNKTIPVEKAVSLIVMPSSLIFNWKNEIEKFTPQLKVYVHTGQNRTKNLANWRHYDLVLTTYGLVRNDLKMLERFPFYYIVLDESQAIKNPQSKIYRSIMQLHSVHKLVLTGTPIENSLMDLWAQMNFVNDGLLGNKAFFQEFYVNRIEKGGDEAQSERLQKLINPFILRRRKQEVASELPALTEQLRYCDMSEEQKRLYEEEKSAVRNELLESYYDSKGEQNALLMVQALNRLRQLANHPRMLQMEEDSGKFAEVIRMLENLISEGHKVLMFSSFVKHLELYRQYFEENNIKFSLLTGQTKDREEVIQQFQKDESNQVFLISLKAGGVGLNLTAADYVFMLDPWWNPAAENQAIARAHRIGQKNKVFVYRFISNNSIEEKIIKLQERKKELADTFVEQANPFKAMTEEEVKELFE